MESRNRRLLPSKDFYNIENDIKTQLSKLDIKFDFSTKKNLLLIVNKYVSKPNLVKASHIFITWIEYADLLGRFNSAT